MSDPDAHHAREALAKLDHLVVQDIFLTETCYYADVILPATAWPEKDGTVTNTDRMVQLGPQGARGAGRGEGGSVDHPGNRAAHGPRLELRAARATCSTKCARRMNSIAGITWERLEAESLRDLSVRAGRRSGPAGGVHRQFPDGHRAREVRAGRHHSRRRAAGRGLPVGADHRAPARALAYRRDDAARRACSMRSSPSRSRRCIRSISTPSAREAGRRDHGGIAPRHHLALRAGRRRHAARRGVHPVLLLRSGGEPADQPGARPVRQDSGVQVLRGEGDERRRAHAAHRATAAGRRLPR